MHIILQKLITIAIAPALLLLQLSGFHIETPKVTGSFNPAGGLTYRLKSTIGSTNTSVSLSSFKNRSDIPLTMTVLNSVIGYGTLSPQSSNSEFISFTGITQNSDGSATLTGVTRGLSDIYPFTASTTLAQPHAGQSIFILSDSPNLFTEYAVKRNAESITGVWTYASTSLPLVEIRTTDAQLISSGTNTLATLNYANNLALAGAPDATAGVKGVVELASNAEQAASTNFGGTGAALVLRASNASSTYNGCCANNLAVITKSNGLIDSNFISTTSQYTWTGTSTFNGTTTILASTNTAPLILNGLSYGFPTSLSTRQASSSALMDDGKGNLSWIPVSRIIASTTDPIAIGLNVSSTTIYRNTIPANTFGIRSSIRFRLSGVLIGSGSSGTRRGIFSLSYGNATTTLVINNTTVNSLAGNGYMEWLMTSTTSPTSQRVTASIMAVSPDPTAGTDFGYSAFLTSFIQGNQSASQELIITASTTNVSLASDQATLEILKE